MRVVNKKLWVITITILVVIECVFAFLSVKSYGNKNITEIKETNKVNKEMFSMYVENKDGDYVEYTDSEYYPVGLKYYFNEERSNCTDNKGKVVNDVISYNNNKITVSSNKTLFCYLYFDLDKVPPQTFTFYLGGSTNPEYINKTSTTAYLSWDDTDITSYCINTENNSSSCSWTGVSGNSVTPSYTISIQGSNTRYAFIRDAAENISPVVSDNVFLDSIAPVITSASDSGSGTANVTVTETGSGVTHVCVNTSSTYTTGCTWDEVSGTTFTSTTAVTSTGNYYIHVKDKAGNIGHRTSAISIAKPVWNLYTLCSKYSNINICEQNENLEFISGIWNSTLEDDGYRYIGKQSDTVNNYICFGTRDKTTCTGNTDLYMYRIIGIFEDSSGNQHIKLIKKEALNTSYKWHSAYATDVDWDGSDLYNGINGDYYLSNTAYSYMQDSTWTDKIVHWNYTATNTMAAGGGVGPLYSATSKMSPKAIYLHELNRSQKTSQTCYNGTTIVSCSVGKWKNVTNKIGLLYVSDMELSLGIELLDITDRNDTILKSSWIHMVNNDTSSPSIIEWSMSTSNGPDALGNYYSYSFGVNTGITQTGMFRTFHAVRPVFYLTSDIKITSGTGTSTDPYIIN